MDVVFLGLKGIFFMKTYFFTPQQSASSSYINRFVQPDSIIPDGANPQAFNRYSYVMNSPIGYNDPTGHKACDAQGGAGKCNTEKTTSDNWNATHIPGMVTIIGDDGNGVGGLNGQSTSAGRCGVIRSCDLPTDNGYNNPSIHITFWLMCKLSAEQR